MKRRNKGRKIYKTKEKIISEKALSESSCPEL